MKHFSQRIPVKLIPVNRKRAAYGAQNEAEDPVGKQFLFGEVIDPPPGTHTYKKRV